MKHPVEALQPLPEDTLCAVATRLELDPGLLFQFSPSSITQCRGCSQLTHELADTAAFGHVLVLKLVVTLRVRQ